MSETPALDQEAIRELSKPNTWRWLSAAAFDWLVIAAAVSSCLLWQSWLGWPLAILLIGNRQHALGTLMHEGVHYSINQRLWLNDLLSDLLAAHPILISTQNYRVFHLAHHRWLDTPRDPEGIFFKAFPRDTQFPQSPLRFVFVLLRDLVGIWPIPLKVVTQLNWCLPGQRRYPLLSIGAVHGSAALAAYLLGGLHVYVLLWLVPMLTVYAATFRLRAITEHHGIEEAGSERYTRQVPDVLRTTRSIHGRVGRALIGPHGTNYHLEHHLYPSVPFYALPRLSKLLEQEAPLEIGSRIRDSYWQAIGECLSPS